MTKAKVFTSGNSQAVRLPKEFRFSSAEVEIAKRKPPEVLARFESLAEGEVAMSLITFGELRYGANRSANAPKALETIERLATAIPVVIVENSRMG